MGLTSRLLRLPRPKTFLYTMSLSTGASLITLSLLLNKVSALYGLLALLTGFELNTLQLSMYIYSLLALGLTAYLAPHIRTHIVNAAYTAAFGVTWFLPESMNSLGVVIVLWTIRLYFCVVMLSYARMVLRRHVALSSVKNNSYTAASKDAAMAENPFRESGGWQGRLGRVMVAFPRAYWLGGDGGVGDEEGVIGAGDVRWMEGMGGKFRKGGNGAGTSNGNGNGAAGTEGSSAVESSGPLERERRRRSGTGPPPGYESWICRSVSTMAVKRDKRLGSKGPRLYLGFAALVRYSDQLDGQEFRCSQQT
ncbi:hypothetical protein EPUS_02574 [Endocarpon pusillum Z07020]|uniref:Uncharacterized protein n=1 Tax=Endocarpon pusillum (strain Z07020 / HMAS-L-300199) TaxID=1263415 RepID=U1GF46_ENDPU|nr:uncharacterized protein EPUS_02574 [Endocarpon pusillum Z07020]ERF70708.1 hypothetical protein EPUS_02574 [Endocarpon pusillum Z07020]